MKRFMAIVGIMVMTALAACQKNNVSKIPHITFISMYPDSAQGRTIKAGSPLDTVDITFRIIDGDADLGNDHNSTNYDIYIKDSRFDSGYHGYFFPSISSEAMDATKGIEGTCTFQQLAAFLIPRNDSVHMKNGDTLYYELYIKDRGQHESNHIVTPTFYIKP